MSDRNNQKPAIIFDGDDTLWDTMSLYNDAKRDYVKLLAQEGFESSSILDTLEEVDLVNIRRMGFSKERFPRSLVQAYGILCQKAGKQTSETVVEAIYRIGRVIFDSPPRLIDDAHKVLSILSRRFRLVLVTRGDKDIQAKRTKQSGLSPFFKAVLVVPGKDETVLREIAHKLGIEPSQTWLVGNSVRSDINPGLRAGFRVIWIPAKTWAYEEEQVVGNPLKIEVLNQLPKVLGVETHG
jgi:putative hydrolase of the HAD superfamily